MPGRGWPIPSRSWDRCRRPRRTTRARRRSRGTSASHGPPWSPCPASGVTEPYALGQTRRTSKHRNLLGGDLVSAFSLGERKAQLAVRKVRSRSEKLMNAERRGWPWRAAGEAKPQGSTDEVVAAAHRTSG